MLERMRRRSLMRASRFAVLLVAMGQTIGQTMAQTTGEAHAGESCTSDHAMRVHIGAQTFNVSVAANPQDRARGLSGRARLETGSGVWFVFPSPDWYGFWMRDMNFPIDLIWISPKARVVGVLSLQPCVGKNCPIHYASNPVAHVLEVNAGAFAGKVGDRVTWSCTP